MQQEKVQQETSLVYGEDQTLPMVSEKLFIDIILPAIVRSFKDPENPIGMETWSKYVGSLFTRVMVVSDDSSRTPLFWVPPYKVAELGDEDTSIHRVMEQAKLLRLRAGNTAVSDNFILKHLGPVMASKKESSDEDMVQWGKILKRYHVTGKAKDGREDTLASVISNGSSVSEDDYD